MAVLISSTCAFSTTASTKCFPLAYCITVSAGLTSDGKITATRCKHRAFLRIDHYITYAAIILVKSEVHIALGTFLGSRELKVKEPGLNSRYCAPLAVNNRAKFFDYARDTPATGGYPLVHGVSTGLAEHCSFKVLDGNGGHPASGGTLRGLWWAFCTSDFFACI